MRRTVLAGLALAAATHLLGAEAYRDAKWSAQGVEVTTADGATVIVEKDKDQVDIEKVQTGDGGAAIGWLALYLNCCTSYPIPLSLVVLSGGKVRPIRNELPIWYWAFRNGAREVCYEQETVHGGFGIRYERRDVVSGELLERYEPAAGRRKPAWVIALDARR
jgi:hypothetical protein